ncbi:hypothetical protein [Xenorhabdus anantnagensis]|uniref:Uncharacterized protein n=1 Tax=Xenorhabdus anantnagensis TaxID=3025875 RepID=A0ABT5LSH1_9GAMM|nr:hypothetical protein [Xenorhabdus anantnagensis]MDC9597280.1 hypothetical protein [Xenorhabdus anantnagensis]
MKIEEILRDTVQKTKSTFKGKSYNIEYIDLNVLPEEKRFLYTKEGIERRNIIFDDLHEELLQKKLTNKEIYKHLRKNKDSYLVGNCMLLSIFSFCYLKEKHKNSLRALFYNPTIDYTEFNSLLTLQILCIQAPYSHAFVMVCPPSNTETKPELCMISEPNVFPQNAWICDPWANIICPAIDYDTMWKIKMAKWNLKGKTVHAVNQDFENKADFNESPLSKYSYTAIQMGRKMTTDIITIHPNGKLTIEGENSSNPKICTIL